MAQTNLQRVCTVFQMSKIVHNVDFQFLPYFACFGQTFDFFNNHNHDYLVPKS